MHLWQEVSFSTCCGRREALQKVKEEWCERISCDSEGVFTIGLCVSRSPSDNIYSTENRKIGIESRRQILQRHMAPYTYSGKERVRPEGSFRRVNLISVILARPGLRRGHERSPYNKTDAPGKQRGTWRKHLQAEKCGQSHILISY